MIVLVVLMLMKVMMGQMLTVQKKTIMVTVMVRKMMVMMYTVAGLTWTVSSNTPRRVLGLGFRLSTNTAPLTNPCRLDVTTVSLSSLQCTFGEALRQSPLPEAVRVYGVSGLV